LKRIWISLLTLIFTVLLVVACSNDDTNEETQENDTSEETNLELPEPDLEGIPDIVAEINGVEVTKEEFENMYQQQFQQVAMQTQLSGEEIDEEELKEQTAEGMVGQELLTQEANARFQEVPDDEINKEMDDLIEQSGMESKDELVATFEEQGTDEKELLLLIETQVKINQLIAEESGDIEPTDKEVEEAYESMKDQYKEMDNEEELPDFEDVKPDISEQLKQQKEVEVIESLVKKLREDADVTIYL